MPPTPDKQRSNRSDPDKTDDVRVVSREGEDGLLRTDTYWGGRGAPDGIDHGHAVVDENGKVRYLREARSDEPGTTREERVTIDDRREPEPARGRGNRGR